MVLLLLEQSSQANQSPPKAPLLIEKKGPGPAISKSIKSQQNVAVDVWRTELTKTNNYPGPTRNYHFTIPKPKEYSTSVKDLPPKRLLHLIKGSGGKRFRVETDPRQEIANRETWRRVDYFEDKGSNYITGGRHPRFPRRNKYHTRNQTNNRRRNSDRNSHHQSSDRRQHSTQQRRTSKKRSKKKRSKSKSSTTAKEKREKQRKTDKRQDEKEFTAKQAELQDLEYSTEDFNNEPGSDSQLLPKVIRLPFLFWSFLLPFCAFPLFFPAFLWLFFSFPFLFLCFSPFFSFFRFLFWVLLSLWLYGPFLILHFLVFFSSFWFVP